MLEVRELDYSYGATTVLRDVSLDIAPGEVVALLGPNGAGKSTLVSLLVGARRARRGSILLHGRRPRARGGRHRIGWVPQAITLFPRLTVAENLRAIGRIMASICDASPFGDHSMVTANPPMASACGRRCWRTGEDSTRRLRIPIVGARSPSRPW